LITAIDTVLEPDETMIQRAGAVNARLLQVFPKGFSLDATHHPHISMLQRYVRTADLDSAYAAVGKVVLANEKAAGWKLKAFKYYYIPSDEIGLAGIVVQPTADMLTLQQTLIDAVAPFTVKTATAAAFAITPEETEANIQPMLIDYVATFVPNATGTQFNPHVTIGVGTRDYLNKMLAEPFDAFTFSPVGVSVYHLGSYGTARKQLQAWELKP